MKTFNKINENAIIKSFYLAEQDSSNLREQELDLYSHNGKKTKHLINNICATKINMTYLELGVYRGGTAIAALYDTKVTTFIGIDDYTIDYKEATLYKKTGWSNCALATIDLFHKYRAALKSTKIEIKEFQEVTSVDTSKLPIFDVIHYDLDNDHASVEQVMRHYLSNFDDYTILIISNWNTLKTHNSFINFTKTPDLTFTELGTKQSHTSSDEQNWFAGVSVWLVERANKGDKNGST